MPVERIGIRMPEELKLRLTEQVHKDGYGPRGKSRWIREALLRMLETDPNLAYVGQGDRLEAHDATDLITLPRQMMLLLNDKILQLRIGAPILEGPRSLLLRSAIRYRLEHPEAFLAKPSSRSARISR